MGILSSGTWNQLKLHDHGISLVGSFIVGFDSDDKSCFDRVLDFAIRSKMEAADFGVLTPYPGTNLYEKLKKEGRLIHNQWWLKYRSEDVVYSPKRMTREELYEDWISMMREYYRSSSTFRRCANGLRRRSLFANILNYKVNMGYRRNAYGMPGEPENL